MGRVVGLTVRGIKKLLGSRLHRYIHLSKLIRILIFVHFTVCTFYLD